MKIKISFLFLLIFCIFPFAMAENNINIDDLALSFKVPDHIEWATRTAGNYDIMEETYHMNRESLLAYMEQGDEYFKGVDPNTDLRVLFIAYTANYDEKNSSSKTDDELVQGALEVALELGANKEDVRVYNTDHTKFIQINFMANDQILNLCQTCIDGMFYTFNVRGTNESYINTMAGYLMETFTLNSSNDSHEVNSQTIAFNNASFQIPESWEQEDLTLDPSMETTCFYTRGSDGLLRYITCNAIDACTSSGTSEALRPFMSGDQYSEQMTILFAGQQNVAPEEIKKYTFKDKNYYGYVVYDGEISGCRLCIVEKGYVYMFVFETLSVDNPFDDELFFVFEDLLNSVVF